MPVFKADDRVRETSTTNGAGTYTLDGAPAGFDPFSSLGANNYVPYFATDDTNWETGIGQVLTAPNRLTRDAIFASSNADAAVVWAGGTTKKIRCGMPGQLAFPRRNSIATGGGAGTTILTQTQQRCHVLELTGALTGDRVIEVDATPWLWIVRNNTTGAFKVTLRVTGQTGIVLQRGRFVLAQCDATDVRMAENVVQRKAADVASAATIDLNVDGDVCDVTGNTGITAVTLEEGREVTTRFTGSPLVTNGASLILPGLQNMQMAAGDIAVWRGYAAGVVRMKSFLCANGHPPLPRSYLAGFGIANNAGDATNDIDVAVGAARSAANDANIVLLAALTKQLDVAWAVGTNAGMLDAGAVGNNTYHIFAIRRPDTGVVDILASLSATAPTMPANYTQKRRIGAILRESAANVAFVQDGDYFRRKASVLDINVTNPGTAAVLRTLSVPTGSKLHAVVDVGADGNSSGSTGPVYLSDPDANDEAGSNTAAPLNTVGDGGSSGSNIMGMVAIRTNTSAQIRSRNLGGAGNVILRIATLGWIDRRGRDD